MISYSLVPVRCSHAVDVEHADWQLQHRSPGPLTFTFTKTSPNSFALEEEEILPSPARGRAANWPSSASSSLISNPNPGGRAGSARLQTSTTRSIRRSRSDLPPRALRTGVAPTYFRQGGLFDLHEGDLQNEHVRPTVSSPQRPANINDTPFPTTGECKITPPQHLRHRHSTSLPTYPLTSIPPERRRPPPKSTARSAISPIVPYTSSPSAWYLPSLIIPHALTTLSQPCDLSRINYHSPLHLTFKHSPTHRPTPSPAATFRARLPRSILIRSPYTIILMQMTHGKSYTNPKSSSQSFRGTTSGRGRLSRLNRPSLLNRPSCRFRRSLHPRLECLSSMRGPLRTCPHPLLQPHHRYLPRSTTQRGSRHVFEICGNESRRVRTCTSALGPCRPLLAWDRRSPHLRSRLTT